MTTIAFTILASGVLIFLLALPLSYRKVPMNACYGVRIPAAFESDQRWYDINAYGGRRLAVWSWLIIVDGIIGFWIPAKHVAIYGISSAFVSFVAIGIPLIQVIAWTRKNNRNK